MYVCFNILDTNINEEKYRRLLYMLKKHIERYKGYQKIYRPELFIDWDNIQNMKMSKILFQVFQLPSYKGTVIYIYVIICVHTSHVIVVTWAQGIRLICMPEARGSQARGLNN